MFNSKHASNNVYVAATQDSEDYQNMLSELSEGLDPEKNLGITHISDAGSPSDHMWSSNIAHWGSGDYPSTDSYSASGDVVTRDPYINSRPLGKRDRQPYEHFQEMLDGLPTRIKRSEAGPLHPATTGEHVVFGGIKNYDSGRHYNIHLFYEPDGADELRLKASTYIPEQGKKDRDRRREKINAHGNHVFDVESGLWHDPSDPSSPTHQSYNPIDVIRSAPADFVDTTNGWNEEPTHSLGFCKTCRRFPKALHRMLSLMRPERCTTCGQKGRLPEYAWESGQFPEWQKGGYPPAAGQSSAMRQAMTPICSNTACDNHGQSVASQPAFIDKDFDVLYPPPVRENGKLRYPGSQPKTVHLLTNDERDSSVKELENLKTVGRSEIAKKIEAARGLGDLSENGDYDAAKDEQGKMEARINELSTKLSPGNHQIISDDEARTIDSKNGSRQRHTFHNPEFASMVDTLGRDNVRQVALPIADLVCDHDDCHDHEMPISTRIKRNPDNSLPCMHCGRTAADGVDVVTSVEDGYTRCNPVAYGANNCAPIPEGKNADSYLGWFKPDPIHKFPIAKRDAETGLGILFQRNKEEQNRSNPEGLYPGTQSVRAQRPGGPGDPVGHGMENERGYFNYGKEHRPWMFLGMQGRKIAKSLSKMFDGTGYTPNESTRRGVGRADIAYTSTQPNDLDGLYSRIKREKQNRINSIGEERIKPGMLNDLAETPIIGDDRDFGIEGLDELHSHILENNPELLAPRPARDHEGRVIHPDLSEDDWTEAQGGFNTSEIPSSGQIFDRLVERGKRNPRKFRIGFRKKSSYKMTKRASDGDLNDYEYRQNESIPELIVEGESYGVDRERGTEPDLTIECPTCDGDSRYNKLENAQYVDNHCKNCDDEMCTSTSDNKMPHCAKCKNAKNGCSGRRRWFWRKRNAICKGCLNEGTIRVIREHCRDCVDKNCKGPESIDGMHCAGCSENHKEKNGEEHDQTPGAHCRLPEISYGLDPRVGPVNDLSDIGEEQIAGTPSNAMNTINKRLREEHQTDFSAEGIDPSAETPDALDYVNSLSWQQRQEDAAAGRLYTEDPLETAGRTISSESPIVTLQRGEAGGVRLDPDIIRSLRQDVQDFRQERPTRPDQSAVFDSPFALNREEALLDSDDTPIKDTDQDDVHINEPVTSPDKVNATIEHDINCAKCDRGIIRADVVGPEKMREINDRIGAGVARIKRTLPPAQHRAAIAQIQADAYKCEG